MSISGALNNAVGGLRAAGRGVEVISSNISNALTPGYGRREIALSASTVSAFGGVKVDGITRVVDESLAADRRLAEAETGLASASSSFFSRIEQAFGTPEQPDAIAAHLANFETGLIEAASRPDAVERLGSVVEDARALANAITRASDQIQDARSAADRTISQHVDDLNTNLAQVQKLNTQITSVIVQGGTSASLMDQRQQVIDAIGALVPVRVIPRDNGQIALYSTAGAVLLDGKAATLEFNSANAVTPYQTVGAGTLSGLTLNGIALNTSEDRGQLRGGALNAQFVIRDELGVEAQAQLDTFARDIIERFQDPSVDTSLSPTDPGLFTDQGAFFDPANEVGLSQRISINARVDPKAGGDTWRIRDGINAAAQGNAGDATLLQGMKDALSDRRLVSSGGFGGATFTASGLVSALTSDITVSRSRADQTLSFASARLQELTERQLADGVDTDSELQRLLLVEQSYAANARMIGVVDELMQLLTRI